MRTNACLAVALLFAAASAASAEDPEISSASFFDSHGKSNRVRTEKITASLGDKGPALEIEVTQEPGKPEKTRVDLPRAEWDSLVRLILGRNLQSWNSVPPPAPDWGDAGYNLGGKLAHVSHWAGPLDGASPPYALRQRLADLAHAHAPKVELIDFTGTSPAISRIRVAGTGGEAKKPNPGGMADAEIEAEAREGAWKITVRLAPAGGKGEGRLESADLAKEEWEALAKLAADAKLADWKADSIKAAPDWGQQMIDLDLPALPVLVHWNGPLPKDAPPRALMLKLVELAAAKVKGVELGALKP
jgi:hypothetical protein